MPLRRRTPLRTTLYLKLSDLTLRAATGLIRMGWPSSTLLGGALALSHRLTRSAMTVWRRNGRTRP